MKPSIAAFLICLFYSSVAIADERTDLAIKFVELLRYKEEFVQYHSRCVAMNRTVSAESLVAERPSFFGGVQPGSVKWPLVQKAYETYFQKLCTKPTEAKFLAVLARAYETSLSTEQLKYAIAFYSTPTGQALIGTHKKASLAAYDAWTNSYSEVAAPAMADFQREIERITAKP